MVQDQMTEEESGANYSTGAIVATAVAAGVIAFLVRRSRQQEPPTVKRVRIVKEALEDSDARSRTAAATRDYVLDRVLPELKPVLLDLLRDVKKYVDDAFKRLESTVRSM